MNIGMADRIIRIIFGAALVALALDLLPIDTPYNYLGWIGVVPLLTATVGLCPIYSLLGISTRSDS